MNKKKSAWVRARYKLVGEDVIGPSGKIITGGIKSDGYYRVDIKMENGKIKTVGYSRLKFFLAFNCWPEVLDHFDQDKLNNTLANLRPATRSMNAANQKMKPGSAVPYKGVTKSKSGKFVAKFRKKHLGTFKTPKEAADRYDAAHRAFYGIFSCLNDPLLPWERKAI
jgi:hypothetical protein